MGNPFIEQSEDLLILDTGYFCSRSTEAFREEQYQNFVNKRLLKCEKSIT